MKHKQYIVYGVMILSLMVNVVIAGKRILQTGGGWNYKDNPQYDADCSMFELNSNDCDVVFLGDSITARGHWEEFYPDINLINRGIGSDTTEGILNRLDEVIDRSPRQIFIMAGCNDLGHDVPENEIASNMDAIVSALIERLPKCLIYIESILPQSALVLERIENINEQYRMISEKYSNVWYVDLYNDFMYGNEIKRGLLSADGVHINGAGYEIWCDCIDEFIFDR